MSLNIFFILMIVVSVVCISVSNRFIDTANCTRHWIAIGSIIASMVGLRGNTDIAFFIFFALLCAMGLFYTIRAIKGYRDISI